MIWGSEKPFSLIELPATRSRAGAGCGTGAYHLSDDGARQLAKRAGTIRTGFTSIRALRSKPIERGGLLGKDS